MQNIINNIESSQKESRSKKFKAWFLTLLILILLLINILAIAINIPAFQKQIGAQITAYIENKTGFRTHLNHIKINFKDGISLNNLSILDTHDSVFIKADKFSTSFLKNILAMVLTKKFDFSDVSLEDAVLNIKKYKGDTLSNINSFVKKLSGKSKSSKCTELNINYIRLKNISITNDIYENPVLEKFYIAESNMDIDRIDLCNKIIDITRIDLNKPEIIFQNKKGYVLRKKSKGTGSLDSLLKFDFKIGIERFNIKQGVFRYVNNEKNQQVFGHFDKNNFSFQDIDIELSNCNIDFNKESNLRINKLAFKEKNGFELKDFSVNQVRFTKKLLKADKLLAKTLTTGLNTNLSINYHSLDDFKDFQKIKIEAYLNKSKVSFADLLYFAGNGNKHNIISGNKNSVAIVNGKISGSLNNLYSQRLKINLDNKVYLKSQIKINDILNPKSMSFDLKKVNFKANIPYLQSFFKKINFGDKVPRFGNVLYQGSLEGNLSFDDILIKGVFTTDLGSSEVDIKTQFDKNLKQVNYKGLLTLKDFDAGTLLDQPELGKIGGRLNLLEGRDLLTNNPKAKLSGLIDSLIYKGYSYRDIKINGVIDARKFDGSLDIKDSNIDLNLDGLIDFQDTIPIFNLSASINSLQLKKLKLFNRDIFVSGKTTLDFMGANPDDFEGYIRLKDIRMKDFNDEILIDSVNISSILNDNGERYLDVDSDYGTMYFDGEYKLKNIAVAVRDMFIRHFGKFTRGFINKDSTNNSFADYYYDFSAEINNSKSLFKIFTGKNLTFNNFIMHGSADHNRDSLMIDVNFDSLNYEKHHLQKFYSVFNLYQGYGDLHIESSNYGLNKLKFEGINFDSDVDRDELFFQLAIDTIGNKVGSIAFSGRTQPLKDSLAIEVYGGFFNAFQNELEFSGENRIVVGKNYLNIENFVLSDKNGRINIEDYNENKGLKLNIKNIDIGIVDLLIKYNKLNFSGLTTGNVSIPNVFNINYIEGNIETPDFKINDDSYGNFNAKIKIDSLDKTKLTYSANLGETLKIVSAKGFFNLKDQVFFGDYYLNEFPLSFLEYIIDDGINGTKGTVDGNLRVYGPFKNISITGNGIANDGQTTVDYLGATFFFDKQRFVVNEKGIDFTGVQIKDRYGNTGEATGGVTFERFLHWGVDVNLTSDKILALNTTKEQNPDYWGVGIGKLRASFKGKFEDIIHMNIEATTARGSNLTIPVKLYVEADDQSFVKFGKRKVEIVKRKKVQTQAKFDVELNVNVTPEAEVTIIMDENAGDNLQGKGQGKIRLLVNENSDIEMYGDFKFLEGKYLFTLYKVVNKEFLIREGSSILWSGDPFDAKLDITADYPGNKVSLKNFLSEYAEIKNANYKADVDLILQLGGSLLRPEINFDFNFRNEDEKLKTYIVSKMQRLKSDINSLNTQVVGIMVFGSFLPDENISTVFTNQPISTTGQSAFYNTVSEFVVTKLSGYLTGLLSEVLSDSDVISGIDISLNSESNTILSNGQSPDANSYLPQYFNVNATLWFFDNKLKIEFGSGYTGKSDISPKSNFFSGENVNMEFFLTEDKRLKVKMFFNRDYNEIIGEWEIKSGLGLGYGREFGKIYKDKK